MRQRQAHGLCAISLSALDLASRPHALFDGATTTLGSGLILEGKWQLMGQIEALSGWLLFGLTTAFLFSQVSIKIRTRDSLAIRHRGDTINRPGQTTTGLPSYGSNRDLATRQCRGANALLQSFN
jgi:hypothetical protein